MWILMSWRPLQTCLIIPISCLTHHCSFTTTRILPSRRNSHFLELLKRALWRKRPNACRIYTFRKCICNGFSRYPRILSGLTLARLPLHKRTRMQIWRYFLCVVMLLIGIWLFECGWLSEITITIKPHLNQGRGWSHVPIIMMHLGYLK